MTHATEYDRRARELAIKLYEPHVGSGNAWNAEIIAAALREAAEDMRGRAAKVADADAAMWLALIPQHREKGWYDSADAASAAAGEAMKIAAAIRGLP